MKRAVLLLIGLLLLMSGCDRYEHEVYSSVVLESGFMDFSESLLEATIDDMSSIMSWYSDEYLHDALTKSDVEHHYLAVFFEYGEELQLSAELKDYWESNRVIWDLVGTLPDSSFVIETQEDYVSETEGSFRFIGNQAAPPELDANLPVVMVEYFTAISCGNCPEAAEKLEEMHNEYGEQLVVIEYVFDSDPGNSVSEEVTYYEAYSQPTSVFQGQYMITGAGEASLQSYDTRYEQCVSAELQFRFTALNLSVEGEDVVAEISWENLAELSGADLRIKAVLLEENPDISYNSAPAVYFENRILKAAELEFNSQITETQLTLESPVELPEDFSVVVWLQNRPESWDSASSIIYNTIKTSWGE